MESLSQLWIYLSSPKSDEHQFFPNNMNAWSTEKVFRIKTESTGKVSNFKSHNGMALGDVNSQWTVTLSLFIIKCCQSIQSVTSIMQPVT